MRQYVLVTYDISNEKRLRRMFKLLRGYGEHVQYSVFLCQLTDKDKVILAEKINNILNHNEDQAILIALGRIEGRRECLPQHWQVIGTPIALSDNSVMIY